MASAPWLRRPGGGGPGVEVRFLTGDGTEVDTEQRPGCSFNGPAGQDITVTIALPGRAFARWKVAAHGWAIEPGTFNLAAGASCQALLVATELTIVPAVPL